MRLSGIFLHRVNCFGAWHKGIIPRIQNLLYVTHHMQEIAKQAAVDKQKERRPKALPGWEKPQPVSSGASKAAKGKPRLPAELVAEVAAQMAGSMGSLNALVWQLEGIREVIQVRASTLDGWSLHGPCLKIKLIYSDMCALS